MTKPQKGPILVFFLQILLLIGPILLLIGGALGTPWALSSLRLWILDHQNLEEHASNCKRFPSSFDVKVIYQHPHQLLKDEVLR